MFGSYIKLKVDKKLWEKVKDVYGKEEDEINIAQKVLEIYLKNKELVKENKEQKRIMDKNSGTIEALRKSLDKIHDKHDKSEEKLASTKKDYNKLKRDYETLKENPVIKERIVYKENKTTIEELRTKRDKLQKELWKTREERDNSYQQIKLMEYKVGNFEKKLSDWKRRNSALLIAGTSMISRDVLEKLQLEIIDSTSYYEWLEKREEFERERKLKPPYSVKLIEY